MFPGLAMDNRSNSASGHPVFAGKARVAFATSYPNPDVPNLFRCQNRAGDLFTNEPRLRHFGVIDEMLWIDATGIPARRNDAGRNGGCFEKLPRNLANRTRSHLSVYSSAHDGDASELSPALPDPASVLMLDTGRQSFTDTRFRIDMLPDDGTRLGTEALSTIFDLFWSYLESLTATLAAHMRSICLIERLVSLKMAVGAQQFKMLWMRYQLGNRDPVCCVRPFSFGRWINVVKLKSAKAAIVTALTASSSKIVNQITSTLDRLMVHRKLLSFGVMLPAVRSSAGAFSCLNCTAFLPCRSGKE